jgi:hypothetical protein
MLERFMPCLPRSTGLRPAHSPPPGALPMQPSTMISSRTRPTMRSWACSAICLSLAKIPALIHSSRRSRIVVAEHCESAIDSYEQPKRRTWISFSKMIRSGIRGRWQPSGWERA